MEIVQGKVDSDKQDNLFLFLRQIRKQVNLTNSDGILFTGYPFLEASSSSLRIDALLVSREYGLVIFDLNKHQNVEEAAKLQDDLYTLLFSKLSKDTSLARRGQLIIDIKTVSFAPTLSTDFKKDDNLFVSKESDWPSVLSEFKSFESDDLYQRTLSIIQAVQRLRPFKRRDKVKSDDSYGAKLKKIESLIANLDVHQNRAIVETNPGPQLIRGMAGTGKTIVLAAKAAYLHNAFPEKRIGVTFFSRSLYGQFRSLINKFCLDQSGYEVDFNKVQVLHAWGAKQSDGFYRRVCRENDLHFFDFAAAKGRWNSKNAFRGATEAALKDLESKDSVADLFDILLIDEGQDMPSEFFQMAYLSLSGEEKQLVIAFDENQRLNEFEEIPNLVEILGIDKFGKNRYEPKTDPNAPKDDITLEVCYRNPKQILTVAHGLELGLYHDKIIDFPSDKNVWEQHGYQVHGSLLPHSNVIISRNPEASPGFFSELLTSDDMLRVRKFDNRNEMLKITAEEIYQNLTLGELEHTDILVIFPCPPYELQEKSLELKNYLDSLSVNSHFAGATDPDVYFIDGSVAISHIYRAKGNESPIVYLLDTDELAGEFNLLYKRKVLFTALTRAKAFCRIYGCRNRFDSLASEVEKIKKNDFTFKIKVPLPSEVLNTKDHFETEKLRICENINNFGINEIFGFLESGLITKEDLPKGFKTKLLQIMNGPL